MTIRDLGYRAYDGPRTPPSSATWVMFRYGLRRAFDPVLLKVLLALALLPAIVTLLAASVTVRMQDPDEFDFASFVSGSLGLSTWFFVGVTSLLAGATAIAEDLQNKAFPFFFAKPLTPAQYLAGRILAIAVVLFGLTFVPSAFVVLGFAGSAPRELAVRSAGFILPVFAESVLVAAVCSATSVGLSAATKNRAVTMSLWVVAWIVPKIVASVVKLASGNAWLDLASVPALLRICSDALLQKHAEADLGTPYALLGLAVYTASAIAFAVNRLERAEVVS